MAHCFICNKKTNRYDDVLSCGNKNCNRVFHPRCADVSSEAFTELNRGGNLSKWLCKNCSSDMVDSPPAVVMPAGGNSFSGDKFDLLFNQVGEIYNKVSGVDFNAMVSSIQRLEETVESLKRDLIKKEEEIGELQKRHEEDRKFLVRKVNELEFFTKKKNIIINGLPVTKGENLRKQFQSIQGAIDSKIPDDAVVDIHRLAVGNSKTTVGNSCPPILVAFNNVDSKKAFMSKKKKKGRLSTSEVNLPGPVSSIYFNDQLTESDAILFRKARARKRSGELAHVWTDGGKILVRKVNGGPITRILSEEDFPA